MSVDIAHTTNRRRGPKVRTGCFTCKIRKVKCDETRPSCSRCTDTGRKCDGYPMPRDSSKVKVLSPSRPIRIFRPTVSGFCALGDSVRYLEFYYHCAAPLLSSRFDRQFWSKIILQLSYSEPAIRHAVVALGYLHKTEPGSIKHARSNFQVLNGSRVFLHHYNEAVRKLVDRMAEPSFVPEIGLATCLLFICIEFFRGNYGTAFTHMTNGLRLIRDWTNDSISVTRPGTLIEHMLLPMFQRGVTSALLYGVAAEEHYDIPVPDPNTFIKLPFSLLEAERTSRELRNASIVFVRNVSIKWHSGVAPSWQDLQTQAQLISCHQRWLAHVESFSHSLPSSSTVDRVSFSALKVVQYATSVHVACATNTHQTAYDAYLPTFHALLDEAEIVIDAISASKPTSPAANFTFEISLVAPLHHTATRCRCPITRRRAISLLERGPPREGLWDAEQHVLVARRTVELEERELDPESGWPVERTRLYSSVIDANMDAAGGFWVHFLPSEWIGMLDEAGRQRQLHEWFVM